MGLLGEHCERAGGLHASMRRVPQDPIAPPPKEREAGSNVVQEVGGGGAGCDIARGRSRLHCEQFLSCLHQETGGGAVMEADTLAVSLEEIVGSLLGGRGSMSSARTACM